MRALHIAAALALALGATACDDKAAEPEADAPPAAAVPALDAAAEEKRANVVGVQPGDAAMAVAIQTARAKLPYFWDAMAAGEPGDGLFTLKVGFATSDGGQEFIWVSDLARNGEAVTGRIANEPVDIPGVRLGQEVTFGEGRIIDWGFSRGGLLIGHYTTRALLTRMPADQAAGIEAMLGEAP